MAQDTGKMVFVLVGANLGNPVQQIDQSYELVSNRCGKIWQRTGLQKTAPWGHQDQPFFYNEIWKLETPMSPQKLLDTLKTIEIECGRKPRSKWYARELDLDILFYGDEIIAEEALVIPHPWHHKRLFCLNLMHQIDPNFRHPVFFSTSKELIKSLSKIVH